MIEHFDSVTEAAWLHEKAPVAAQVAATLAAFTLRELQPTEHTTRPAEAEEVDSRLEERAGVAD
jgi:hypothetical protein